MRLPNVTRSPKLLLYDVRSELCVCYAVLSHSVVSDTFVTPWTAACQAPLFMGILQAIILEWVSVPFSRGSFQPRDLTQVSCTVSGSLSHQGSHDENDSFI